MTAAAHSAAVTRYGVPLGMQRIHSEHLPADCSFPADILLREEPEDEEEEDEEEHDSGEDEDGDDGYSE